MFFHLEAKVHDSMAALCGHRLLLSRYAAVVEVLMLLQSWLIIKDKIRNYNKVKNCYYSSTFRLIHGFLATRTVLTRFTDSQHLKPLFLTCNMV